MSGLQDSLGEEQWAPAGSRIEVMRPAGRSAAEILACFLLPEEKEDDMGHSRLRLRERSVIRQDQEDIDTLVALKETHD